MTDRITVFGAGGYIGSALVTNLRRAGTEVIAVTRENIAATPAQLGHAIYAIGLTSDFRSKPVETVQAHVVQLSDLLASRDFVSFTYLSSTRLYKSELTTHELSSISVSPVDADDIYTLSKLLGEALVFRLAGERGRVCRLSNVYGGNDRSSNFLTSILADARASLIVRIMQASSSEKDYVHIDDTCRAIEAVAMRGTDSIYNVAAGRNTTHQQIADQLKKSGVAVEFGSGPVFSFKPINVQRLCNLINWNPRSLVLDLPELFSNPEGSRSLQSDLD
jgi:nucleoside-diphosphate-sugar epimerase